MEEKITCHRPKPMWFQPLNEVSVGIHPPFSTTYQRRLRLGDALSEALRDYFTEANLEGLDFEYGDEV